jgi:hypothetical protein
MAERAKAVDGEARLHLSEPRFLGTLADMIVAGIEAPAGAELSQRGLQEVAGGQG